MRVWRIGSAMVWLIMAGVLGLAGGCGYSIQGRVIAGSYSTMGFVGSDDPGLAKSGVDAVRITLERDPTKPNRAMVAEIVSGPDGRFSLPVDAFGAGWMDEEWLIRASRPGYEAVESILRLPSGKQRLLIRLSPGNSVGTGREDSVEEMLKQFDRR